LEDSLDDVGLHSVEVDHTGEHWERGVFFIVGFNFVEGSQRTGFLTLLEMFIQGELTLFGEDTSWELVRLWKFDLRCADGDSQLRGVNSACL